MKKIRKVSVVILSVLIFLGLTVPAPAQDTQSIRTTQSLQVELSDENRVVQEVSTLENEMIGHIDWENNVVYAVGDGVPPEKAVNAAQARALAKRAAIDTAMARLVETIREVRVDSESTTRNYVTENYVVQTRVSGLIKNAVIEELRQAEDGSYQIKMSMPINGAQGLSSALLPFEMQKAKKVKIVTVVSSRPASQPDRKAPEEKMSSPEKPSPPDSTPHTAKSPEAETSVSYTGLIIDAKGLGASPGMYPNIKTGSGTVLYNISVADPNAAVTEGLCAYRKSLEQAEKIQTLGDSPLLVKAVRVDGTNKIDLIVEDADGEKIIQANTQNGFLTQARVAVVID